MDVVAGATSSLLPKLGALLQDEYKLQDKVRKDIESLQNELVFMNATLRMVAEVPRDQLDEHVRIWAVFVKEVSYDMEDVVNTFVARVHGTPHLDGFIKGIYRKAFNMLCMGTTHHEMAGMIQEIRSLIKEVADLRDRYRFDNIITRVTASVVLLRRDNMLTEYLTADCEEISCRPVGINYEEPIGVERDMNVLHDWITSGYNYGSMMYILGPSGIGKTTIAMGLCQDYGDQFQCQLKVNVSQNSSDPKMVLMDILSQVKPRELQDHDGDILNVKAELKECLQGKGYTNCQLMVPNIF